jgi:hypothetical protein
LRHDPTTSTIAGKGRRANPPLPRDNGRIAFLAKGRYGARTGILAR